MKGFTLVALVASAVFVTNCAKPPLDCESIVPSAMRALPFGALTPGNGHAWVAEHLKAEAGEDVQKGSVTVGPTWHWKDNMREYSLYFHNRGSEPRLSLGSLVATPLLDDVIRCFGPPEYYRGAILADTLDFELWYVTRGWSFEHAQFKPTKPFVVSGSLGFQSISLVQPGGLDQMGRRTYSQLESAKEQAALLADVRPWPASMTEITFTTRFLEWSLGR